MIDLRPPVNNDWGFKFWVCPRQTVPVQNRSVRAVARDLGIAVLVNRPFIAVPTSVGYGANLRGLAALLTILNSCVPGITVVNIENGCGAGVAAGMINQRDDEA